MKACLKCGTVFGNYTTVGGIIRNISKRKYCLECSPFGKHNTKKIHTADSELITCHRCGLLKTKSNFYSNGRSGPSKICKPCANRLRVNRFTDKKREYIDKMGGGCCVCGYSKYIGALEFHHKDPGKKDPKFKNFRDWSIEKAEHELKDCILLCSNCHKEIHAGS